MVFGAEPARSLHKLHCDRAEKLLNGKQVVTIET